MDYKIAFWTNERLGKELALDFETSIAPFHTELHKPILGQAYNGNGTVYLFGPKDIKRFMNRHWDSKFIFQNAPFDLGVMRKYIGNEVIHDLFDNGQIADIKILYQLYHLAAIGMTPMKSSLAHIAKQLLNVELNKDGGERTSFGQFEGLPIEEIPEDHLKYAAEDAVATFDAYCQLLALIKPHDEMNTLLSHDIQVKGDYALNIIYKNGIGFDLARKDEWLEKADIDLSILQERLATYGWVRGVPGIKTTYENIVTMLGIADKLPRTEKSGDISSKDKDLERFKDIPFIKDLCDFNSLDKTTSFVREVHSTTLHPRYTTIKNTGRTSASGPNIQNLPRAGGIREMFIPRKRGNVFVDVDYSAIELSTLAQVLYNLYGDTVMGDMINEGKDLHTYAAAKIFNVIEEEVTKDQRQFAKIQNFGLGANMGATTFVDYAAQFGTTISEVESQDLKDKWLTVFPRMNDYFDEPSKNTSQTRGRSFTHYTLTGRKRADCTYTAFLNTGFQGLAADGLKLALYELTKQGYQIVAQIHDQVVVECSAEQAPFVQREVQRIMVEQMKKVVPDIAVRTEGQIIERFCK